MPHSSVSLHVCLLIECACKREIEEDDLRQKELSLLLM